MDRDVIRADLDAEGVHPLSRLQYERLVDTGVLGDARVELLLGRMLPTSPRVGPTLGSRSSSSPS